MTAPPPVGPHDERVRRAAVLELLARGPARRFPPTLSVGDPEGPWATYVDRSGPRAAGERLDHALRADVVGALLAAVTDGERAAPGRLLAWLSRPGAADEPDCDRAWLSACRAAAAELEVTIPFVVVTRKGWSDPVTGASRTWVRLRDRRRGA